MPRSRTFRRGCGSPDLGRRHDTPVAGRMPEDLAAPMPIRRRWRRRSISVACRYMPLHAFVCQNPLESAGVCRSLPESAGVCLSLPDGVSIALRLTAIAPYSPSLRVPALIIPAATSPNGSSCLCLHLVYGAAYATPMYHLLSPCRRTYAGAFPQRSSSLCCWPS